MNYVIDFFSTDYFMPHGHCFLWRPDLLILSVGSDFLIAISYFSIPFALVYLIFKRKDLIFNSIFWLFSLFIACCGFTHLFSILTVWTPIYQAHALVNSLTAIVSLVTAISLWYYMPKLLSFPSSQQLREMNLRLSEEINQREDIESKLRFQNIKLKQSEELKNQFIANISHDLRTPLTLILSPIEELLRSKSENEGIRPKDSVMLRLVHENSLRLQQMIDSLLDMSKIEAKQQSIDKKFFNIHTLVEKTVEMFQYQAKKKRNCNDCFILSITFN